MTPTPPHQPRSETSRAGAERFDPGDRKRIAELIVQVLHEAGPVSDDGTTGGATTEELTLAVSRLRGLGVKESTINGRVAGDRPELEEHVVKSGRTRKSRAGVPVTVYVHRRYVRSIDQGGRVVCGPATGSDGQALAAADGGGIRSPAELPADLRETFEHRAAVLEYDAGLSRAEAETQALLELAETMRAAQTVR